MSTLALSAIIALARAGSLDHAWAAFVAAGYDRTSDDPAALAVKGRLLKDRALRARGEERRRFYLQSAESYRQSAALQPGTYPLINAATLSLLSGDHAMAEAIAREVLGRIGRDPDEPETPYWKAATEAEALLLLGRRDEAEGALRRAIAVAPRAWEDHASTLRQFLAIHEAAALDSSWLAMLRPPRAVHYVGRQAPAGDASSLEREIGDFLEERRCGFGFGALAAGGDLLCAEALIDRELPLHVVLPSDPVSYAAAFVDPFGEAWRRRFDAALEAAESVELVRPLGPQPAPRRLALGDEVALGAALLHGERMMSEAVQLVIGSEESPASPRAARTLLGNGQAIAPRPAGSEPSVERAPVMLIALLALSVGRADDPGFEARLEAVRNLIEPTRDAPIAPHLSGDCILIGQDAPDAAVEAALRINAHAPAELGLRIAGHYGFVACVRDPFQGTLRPTEGGAEMVRAIAAATPPGTVCVSHDLAAVIAARVDERSGANWIGELQALDGGPAIGLYAVSGRAS